jgi:hypothetical protein
MRAVQEQSAAPKERIMKVLGHQAVKYLYVTAEEVKRVSGFSTKGFFRVEFDFNGKDELKVKQTIWINKDVDNKTKQEIKAHEEGHFKDAKVLLAKLKQDIDKAIKAGRDPELSGRLDWFNFDYCNKSNARHRENDGYGTDMCFKPESPRPK